MFTSISRSVVSMLVIINRELLWPYTGRFVIMMTYHDEFLGGKVDSDIFNLLQGDVVKGACNFFQLDNWHVCTTRHQTPLVVLRSHKILSGKLCYVEPMVMVSWCYRVDTKLVR